MAQEKKDKKDPTRTVLYERLPIMLNLGETPPVEAIGWSGIYRNEETGAIQIEMELVPEVSARFQNLHEIFEIKALGFAGIARKPAP